RRYAAFCSEVRLMGRSASLPRWPTRGRFPFPPARQSSVRPLTNAALHPFGPACRARLLHGRCALRHRGGAVGNCGSSVVIRERAAMTVGLLHRTAPRAPRRRVVIRIDMPFVELAAVLAVAVGAKLRMLALVISAGCSLQHFRRAAGRHVPASHGLTLDGASILCSSSLKRRFKVSSEISSSPRGPMRKSSCTGRRRRDARSSGVRSERTRVVIVSALPRDCRSCENAPAPRGMSRAPRNDARTQLRYRERAPCGTLAQSRREVSLRRFCPWPDRAPGVRSAHPREAPP